MGATALADNAYLKRRSSRKSNLWYVRVPVPKDLQEILRKRTIERPLKTSDINEARRRKHPVLMEILEGFERARGRRITSADIEHEAQRFLRERLEQIAMRSDDTFTMLTDVNGNDLELAGDSVLATLREELEQEDWSSSAVREADKIARQYGVTPIKSQRDELCRALQLAEIEALSRALSIHKGGVPEPISVLNARAVDPLTAIVSPRALLAPRQGEGVRVSEAAKSYFADRNRQRSSALTGQTTNQSRATLRLFSEFTRDAPLSAIKRRDVADFLSNLARINPSYGRRSSAKKLKFDELLKKYPTSAGHDLGDKTLNRHAAVIAGMFDWAITSGTLEGANPATESAGRNTTSPMICERRP